MANQVGAQAARTELVCRMNRFEVNGWILLLTFMCRVDNAINVLRW